MFSSECRRQFRRRCPFRLLVASLFLSALELTGCKGAPKVSIAHVERGAIEASVTSVTSGTVRPEKIAELAFGTVGRVRSLNVELGDVVKEGDILAEVENDDLVSRLEVAKEELERARKLSVDQAMSRSSFMQAQGNFETARIAYEKSLIRAPYDGMIAERNLEVGQLSQITAVIPVPPFRIVDLEPRFVRAEIDEVDMPRVKLGMAARVKILAVRREPFAAKIRKVVEFVSSVREQDRTTEIELSVDSEGVPLPVGASADVEIVTDIKPNVVTVTSRALLGRGGERYVFVLDGATARRRPVKVGIFNYTTTEILEGLKEGEAVILPSDKVELQDGLKVIPEG